MSVLEIGQLHARYVRLSEKFKAAWTYHQFATGVYKNLLQQDFPAKIEFQALYDGIKGACDMIQSAASAQAGPKMDRCDEQLERAIGALLRADQAISASLLRRFFQGLKRHDEKILFNIIKFYLYAGATEGDARDKLDFLFTQVGEDFVEERGEYSPKDTLELRKHFQSLVAVRPPEAKPQEEIVRLIRAIRTVREQIQNAETFEDLTQANLLTRSREVKESLGDQFLHPDVLLAVVECNVTTKNKFEKLYRDEEKRILEDARRLLENEDAIARGFGESNPDLLVEMKRFKEVKQEFDDSRARHDVKHKVISRLKASMNNILTQLDRGLGPSADVETLSDDFLLEVQQADAIQRVMGDDPLLEPYLRRIIGALDSVDPETTVDRIARAPAVAPLRLEPWEITAWKRLFADDRPSDQEDLLRLFLNAAALRMRIDDQAHALSAVPAHERVDPKMLVGIKASLERAKDLDTQFKDFLQESVGLSTSRNLHRLYRSRLRLLRGFSGLWLIYDLRAGGD
ncbi:MAG: hypothetical protein ACRD2J_14390 [Thermoanaerobaculia bacterium]